jgi:hypothetical protein
MLIIGAAAKILGMRVVAGAFVFLACCLGVAGVIFLARPTRSLLRAYWVTEASRLDGSRELPPAPAVRKTDIYGPVRP